MVLTRRESNSLRRVQGSSRPALLLPLPLWVISSKYEASPAKQPLLLSDVHPSQQNRHHDATECRASTQWKHAQASRHESSGRQERRDACEENSLSSTSVKLSVLLLIGKIRFLKLSESAMLYFREVLDTAESKTQGQRNDLASKSRDPRTHVAGENWLLKVVL